MTVPTDGATVAPVPFDSRQFRITMGKFATGVTIVTTYHEGQSHGMTANSFLSVSLDPPLVLVSVAARARLHALLAPGCRYGVSVLADDQEALSRHFCGPSDRGITHPIRLAAWCAADRQRAGARRCTGGRCTPGRRPHAVHRASRIPCQPRRTAAALLCRQVRSDGDGQRRRRGGSVLVSLVERACHAGIAGHNGRRAHG